MVLQELGEKITKAFRNLNSHTTVGESEIDSLLRDICNALVQADVNVKLVVKLRQDVKTQIMLTEGQVGFNKRKLIQKAVFDSMKKMLDAGVKPYQPKKGTTNIIMFVGMQGAGKTTSCTKYAAYYQKKGFKVALVCVDTFRAGAYDQLKQNAARARVRFYGSLVQRDPVVLAKEAISTLKSEGLEIIIIDTSGRHKQEESLFEEMKEIQAAIKPKDIVYVIDSTNGQMVQDQAMAFREAVPIGSIILTKMDGHAKGGGALSAIAVTKSPIIFLGVGEHYDELEPFNAQTFVGKMLGFGDIEGLVDVMKQNGIDDKELYKKLSEGSFTLRDMYEQLEKVVKLGPMGKFLEMIPGFSSGETADGKQDFGNRRLKHFINIMDSMNDDELDATNVKKAMTDDRISRIARGSGRSIRGVHDMLRTYQRFDGMAKSMGKANFLQLSKDPTAIASHAGKEQIAKMSKFMDPNILKRMGGTSGLQGLMKEMSKYQ
ncbi:hypothetical protein XU18_1096 [Perkinsela sp. CCAP 1560/4]|nr:hypothetical protein XU18_1096 [Perkinsela sp. CCAP 1560/4]|eukprot:KNH08383.1 hypothetical protein XU18_1096 [Perkinsela sp. CCAP 1560/4]